MNKRLLVILLGILVCISFVYAADSVTDFLGNISDYGVDTDEDGLYDYLVIKIGADITNITEEGIYYLEAEISSEEGGSDVSNSNHEVYLSKDDEFLYLNFSGLQIHSERMNGPYDLCSFEIYMGDSDIYEGRDLYTTKAYSYEDFEKPPEFNVTGNLTDYGTDVNGDGLYDYLTVKIPIDVKEAADYSVKGWIYKYDLNKDKTYEIGEIRTDYYLTPDDEFLYLNFNGSKIYDFRKSGSYELLFYIKYKGTTVCFPPELYYTYEYNYQDFQHEINFSTIASTINSFSVDSDSFYIVVGDNASAENVIAAINVGVSLQHHSMQLHGINNNELNYAMLDSEINEPYNTNLVSVGMPQHNSITNLFLDSSLWPLEQNTAIISVFEHNNSAVLVIAGNTDLDTRKASKVIANYEDYNLDDTCFEVDTIDLTLTECDLSKYPVNDTTPPAITITNPVNNSTITEDSVWLNVTTDEDAVCSYTKQICKFFEEEPVNCSQYENMTCQEMIDYDNNVLNKPYARCECSEVISGCNFACPAKPAEGCALRNPIYMSETGGTLHTQLITNLKNTSDYEWYGFIMKSWYELYVNCTDYSDNSNTESVTFYVNLTEENCTPNWLLNTDWTVCNADGLQFKYYYDSNDCYAKTGLISDNIIPEEEQIQIRSRGDDRYQLEWVDGDGNEVSIPLLYTDELSGNMTLGDHDHYLIINESMPIRRNDYFILSPGNGKSYAMQYKGADSSTGDTTIKLKFKNLATSETSELSMNITNLIATLTLGGTEFIIANASNVEIGTDDFNISVDLNANGILNDGEIVNIEMGKNALIELKKQIPVEDPFILGGLTVSITTPYNNNLNTTQHAEIIYNLTQKNGEEVTLNQLDNITLETPLNDLENSYGYTKYGSLVRLEQPPSSPPGIYITYPEIQSCNFESPIIDIINPINNSTITESSVWLNVTTDEDAVCSYTKQRCKFFEEEPINCSQYENMTCQEMIDYDNNVLNKPYARCECSEVISGCNFACPAKPAEGCALWNPVYMSETGGTLHTQLITNLKNTSDYEWYGFIMKSWYELYVNCTDYSDNSNTESVTFYVNLTEENCTTPTDGMVITEDTTFCQGTYDLPNGITIGNDNVVLDCDGAVLNGDRNESNRAIYLDSKENIIIKHCNLNNYYYYIQVYGSNNITIKENIIYNNGGNHAIGLSNTHNSLIENNLIDMNGFGNGISLTWWSSNNTIRYNNLKNGYPDGSGIGLERSNNNLVANNHISNFVVGLQLWESAYNNVIEKNTLVNNSWYGIQFFEGYDNIIRKNNIMSNNIGIIFKNHPSVGNIIESNNIYDNIEYQLHNNIAQNITAQNNYWGTTNITEIQNKIYDYYDDNSKGIVDFCPYLDAPWPDGNPISCDNENKLAIHDLDVRVDGETDKNLKDGDKIGKEAKPESKIEFEVQVENLFSTDEDIEIEDVTVAIKIEDIDDGDDLITISDDFDLDPGDRITVSLDFEIPLIVNEGVYDVIIKVEGEDDNGAEHEIMWNLKLEVVGENQPPTITITNPVNGSTITEDSVWLNVTTDENAVCEYNIDESWSNPQEIASGLNPEGYQPSQLGVSIDIDSEDNWHVTYYDGAIKYINSTSNQTQIAAPPPHLHSMAIDSNNKLHLVYFVNGHSIMYINNVAGYWSNPQEIASGLNPEGYSTSVLGISLTIDSEDNWHVVYYDEVIKYINSISGPVTLATGDVRRPSVAVDSDDKLHVVYFLNRHSIMYLNNTLGSWSNPQEIVGNLNPGGVGATAFGVSIDIDSEDNWHIVYYDEAIKYINSISGPVTLVTGNVRRPNIAVDSDDELHVVYFVDSHSIMYMKKKDSVTKNIPTTNGEDHAKYIENLKDKFIYDVIVDCKDAFGNSNTETVSFNVNFSKADLMLTDIIFEPEKPVVGGFLQVHAEIKNIGSIATAFQVEFERIKPNGGVSNGGLSSDPDDLIEPGETVNVSFLGFGPLMEGWYNVTVTVRSEKPDSNLSNNKRREDIYVSEENHPPQIVSVSEVPSRIELGDTIEFSVTINHSGDYELESKWYVDGVLVYEEVIEEVVEEEPEEVEEYEKPIIENFENITVHEGDTIELNPVITDPEGGSITLEYSGWMTSSTKTTNFDDAGTYHVTLTAVSGSGESTAKTITITILDVNRPPVIIIITEEGIKPTPPNSSGGGGGGPVIEEPEEEIEDIHHSSFTYHADEIGEHEIKIVVSDGEFEVENIWDIDVKEKINNTAPTFSGPIADITWEEDTTNTSLNLNDYFSDINGDDLTYKSSETTHISVSISDGEVTLTPEPDWYGQETIIFTATDGYETVESNEIKLIVTNVNDALIIDSFNPSADTIIITEDGSQTFTILASDIDGTTPSIKWYVNNNSVAAGNSYTYTAKAAGTFTIKAEVSDGIEIISHSWTLIASDKPIADSFDGDTTNFSELSNLASVEYLTLEKSQHGKIKFDDAVDLRDILDFDGCVIINKNIIGIDSDCLPTLKDKSARITLYDVEYSTTPVIYYNNGFIVDTGDITEECDFCTLVSYDSAPTTDGTVVFDVEHFTVFKIEGESKLKISDIEVMVNDEKDSSADEDGGKIDVYPGSEITIDIELENLFDDKYIKNIDVEGVLEDINDGRDIKDEDEISKINDGDEKTATLNFKIPLEVKEDDYDLIIEVKGKDEDGNYLYAEVEFTVEVEKKSHDILIQKAEFSLDTLTCARSITLNIKLLNLGEDDEDDIILKITNSDLGISLEEKGIKLETDPDEDNTYSKTFQLNIKENITSKTYPITVDVYYDKSHLISTKTVNLVVKDCEKTTSSSYASKTTPKSTIKTEPKNSLQIVNSLVKEQTTTIKTTETSFRDTSEYIMLLTISFVILFGLMIFLVGVLVFKARY